jgi:hypothetical protein
LLSGWITSKTVEKITVHEIYVFALVWKHFSHWKICMDLRSRWKVNRFISSYEDSVIVCLCVCVCVCACVRVIVLVCVCFWFYVYLWLCVFMFAVCLCVRSVVDKLTLGQVLVSIPLSPANSHSTNYSTFINHPITNVILISIFLTKRKECVCVWAFECICMCGKGLNVHQILKLLESIYKKK